ncbi:hypothetical protein [Embleya sp. NPDC059259]|uniref:hypothetical protein n=1 Tax=unclassified Embleya TaxID=2699296 RepID=UPI00369A415D
MTCVRVAAVLSGAASAFALIDPIKASTAALPVSRGLRQGLRTLLALLPVGLAWAAVVAVGTVRSDRALPWAGLTLEAAVPTCTALAAAASAVHRVPGKPATALAVGALPTLLAGTLALPASLWPWPDADADDWSHVHRLWAALLIVPALTLRHANHRPYRPTP